MAVCMGMVATCHPQGYSHPASSPVAESHTEGITKGPQRSFLLRRQPFGLGLRAVDTPCRAAFILNPFCLGSPGPSGWEGEMTLRATCAAWGSPERTSAVPLTQPSQPPGEVDVAY